MKCRALLFKINFNHTSSRCPSAARIGHEDSLIEAKHGNRNQVADEKNGSTKANARWKEDGQEDIKHALLRILRANLDDLLTVFHRSFLNAFEPDVCFDELHRAISAGCNSLD